MPKHGKLFPEAPVLSYVTSEANSSLRVPPRHPSKQHGGYLVHQIVSSISFFPTQTAGNFPAFFTLFSPFSHSPSKDITHIYLFRALSQTIVSKLETFLPFTVYSDTELSQNCLPAVSYPQSTGILVS